MKLMVPPPSVTHGWGTSLVPQDETLDQENTKAGMPMTRYNFAIDKKYAGKLLSIHQRPIENDPTLSLHLLRLEFEIYWQLSHEKQTLRSEGELACRDIVIGKLIRAEKDAGQQAYASALGIRGDLSLADSWLRAAELDVWVEIEFGPPEQVGQRNPFRRIARFDPSIWQMEPYRFDRGKEWVTVAVAADAVTTSEATVRRRVDEWEIEFGGRLVRRTFGRQRRIYLPLFVNLWSETD